MLALMSTAMYAEQIGRPKVGVVLCGGGAKGAAHVGVLKVLEENNIPIDYLAGTSMGAVVGGLYAMGYTADELHDLLIDQDWTTVMQDKISREGKSFEHMKNSDQYALRIPFGLHDYSRFSRKGGAENVLGNIPMAFVQGQNVYNLLTKLSVGYQDSIDFNRMPIPFSCVAVDLISKKEVVLHSGNLVESIRSSMSIPGYFAPVKMGDMVLVDGGMLNNYPVDVVRKMGADIVIGVLLGGSDEKGDVTIESIGDIVTASLDMFMDVKLNKNVSQTDILITPSVKGFGVLSFDNESLDSLVTNGVNAAKLKETELKKLKSKLDKALASSEKEFVGPKIRHLPKYNKAVHLSTDTVTIGNVTLHGLTAKDIDVLMRKTIFKPGVELTGSMIDGEIDRLYSTGAFESVTYSLHGMSAPYDMHLYFVKGKSSVLGLGFRFDTEEIASILVNVGINANYFSGHKLDLTAKLAYNPQVALQYSYAFRPKSKYQFSYKFRSTDTRMHGGSILDALQFTEHSFSTGLSSQQFKSWSYNFGVRMDIFNYPAPLSGASFLDYDVSPKRNLFLGAFAQVSIDRRDRQSFPTRGFTFDFKANYVVDRIFHKENKSPDFLSSTIAFEGIIPCGNRFNIIGSVKHRSVFGSKLPVAYMNIMGGFEPGRYMSQQLSFYGFTGAYVFEKNLSTAELDFRGKILDNHYVYATGNVALHYDSFKAVLAHTPVYGARLGYAYDSIIGPLSLNLMWSNLTRKLGVYVSLGYSF